MKRFHSAIMITILVFLGEPKPLWAQAPKPDGPLAIVLIRDALTAVNQANWTGNYAVLRDYASPNFAKANDLVHLTVIFQPIRAEGLDLAPALFLTPKVTKAELKDKGKKFLLKGYFESKPKQIHFEMIFEPIATRWRLFGIGVRSIDASSVKKRKTQTLPPIAETLPMPSDLGVNGDAVQGVPIPAVRPKQ